jgi:hypothetical protein
LHWRRNFAPRAAIGSGRPSENANCPYNRPAASGRTRRWREYCCESFCDTAAWLYSGMRRHPEFALAAQFSAPRRAWFGKAIGERELPV